jgi:hypothetical protein
MSDIKKSLEYALYRLGLTYEEWALGNGVSESEFILRYQVK